MTQAYNLAILANAVDTSGRLNVGTNATGTLPQANGGTGSTALSSVAVTNITAGSGISVSASTGSVTISTSGGGGVTSLNGQTGAITNTTIDAIGSYIDANRTDNIPGNGGSVTDGFFVTQGNTSAGSSLRYNRSGWVSNYNPNYPPGSIWSTNTKGNEGTGSMSYDKGGTALSGTWRCMSRGAGYVSYYEGGNNTSYGSWGGALWVRIS